MGLSDEKADANTEYLQKRMDEITRVLRDLVAKVNSL
jgi:hypothetical protein